ncbi:phosphatidate cytidylyltransferase [Sphingomonas bacterium]|uniref:phosphatidate cytidylyltransferase n=1 Tax=Sphingomonas bacterium TaxID=1895847 RepID=UPI0034A048C1
MNDLKLRTLVGAGLAVVAIAALAIGGIAWWALLALIGLGMIVEWCGLAGATRPRLVVALAGMVVGLALACPLLWGADRSTVAAFVGLALLVGLLTNNGRIGTGLCYAGFPVAALLFLRDGPHGFAVALWTLLIVWATDIGAYFAGRLIGGPLLAPRLSPGKTWAGLGGGMAAALLVGALVAFAARLAPGYYWLGAPMALLAQAGDLYESALKRRAGVKDSGRLLPGHGGLLDRLDGLVPVAVAVGALVANNSLAG